MFQVSLVFSTYPSNTLTESSHHGPLAFENLSTSIISFKALMATLSGAPASSSSQICTFLSIPPEIRLRIYHYLFEPEDDCFLSGPHGVPWRECLRTPGLMVERFNTLQGLSRLGRHPEILRVNHQIYFEAFPVLYSVFELLDPSKGTWRYKLLEGDTPTYYYNFMDDNECFDVVYDPPLMHGVTEPPKLAKFKKVLLNGAFDVTDLPGEWKYDEEYGKLDDATQQQLADIFRKSNMIADFVKLLAGCSWVDHVDLDIGLLTSWDSDQSTPASSSPIEGPELARWVELKNIRRKGDIQVADIFLASGILDPLKRLFNVGSWCLELTVEDVDRDPRFLHEKLTLDLSNAVKHKR